MARVLVVDDDGAVRRVLRQMLERAGHDVAESADGMNVVQRYREDGIDVVIMDIYMPEKAGLESILELRTEFPDAKIIAVSGGGGAFDLQPLGTAQHLGVSATLAKPFGWDALEDAIAKALGA